MPDSSSSFSNGTGGLFPRKSSLFGFRTKGATANVAVSSNPQDPYSANTTSPPPKRRVTSRYSLASNSVTDLGQSLRRSTSVRSSSTNTSGSNPTTNAPSLAVSYSPERNISSSHATKPSLSISTFSRRQPSSENVKLNPDALSSTSKSPPSAADPSKAPFGMAAIPLRPPAQSRPPGTSQSNLSFGSAAPLLAPSAFGQAAGNASVTPNGILQNIQEQASKRISTLDYLRKANEGRVYWFNTLLFTKGDLTKIPYFDNRKLARRATNYLLLGYSLTTILDLNSQTPYDFLRALNALLVEFESYQSLHPPDGSTSSSLSRGRVTNMFKRATGAKGRRSSAATDFGFPNASVDSNDGGKTPGANSALASFSFPSTMTEDTFAGEDYTYLLTPSLPFDPDYFETFATLCDALIDCYQKIMQLISTPEACGPGVGDFFAAADKRVRKVLVAGIVREFENESREGVKKEVAGVGKVVLGGLVGPA